MSTENMYKVLFEAKFTYDPSWPLNIKFNGESRIGPMYPYTFNYISKQICPTVEEPCPKMSYPGLWKIPNVNIMNSDHSTCASMMGGCYRSGIESVGRESDQKLPLSLRHKRNDICNAYVPELLISGPGWRSFKGCPKMPQMCWEFGKCMDLDGLSGHWLDARSTEHREGKEFSTVAVSISSTSTVQQLDS